MSECHGKCEDVCFYTKRRECRFTIEAREIAEAHKRAIENGDEIMMAYEITFSDGEIGPCYALVSNYMTEHGARSSATAISIKRAIELQEIGYPFNGSHPIYAGDVDTFFPPDFKSLGGNTMRAFTERTPEALGDDIQVGHIHGV